MKREKKAKQDHGTVFSTLCMVLFGAALGIFAGKDLFEIVEGVSFGEYLLHVAWLIVMMTAAFYLQTILHEGGHLVCGLLTGYRFVSFRIGSWMVQRENGRLRFHRYTLAGTAGQCLLAPPEFAAVPEFVALYREQVTAIHLEDVPACEGVQQGVESPLYRPGPLSHLEQPLWRFHRHLQQAMAQVAGAKGR